MLCLGQCIGEIPVAPFSKAWVIYFVFAIRIMITIVYLKQVIGLYLNQSVHWPMTCKYCGTNSLFICAALPGWLNGERDS